MHMTNVMWHEIQDPSMLGQMLEKEGRFAVRIFPDGLVLSQDCSNCIYILFHCII